MTHHQNSSLVNIAREKVVSARLRSDKAESCIDAVMQEKQALALKLSEIQEKVVRLECELQQRQEETLLLRARVGTLESLLPAACALADGAQAISMESARHASGLSVSPLHEHADIWPQESLKKLPSARSSWPKDRLIAKGTRHVGESGAGGRGTDLPSVPPLALEHAHAHSNLDDFFQPLSRRSASARLVRPAPVLKANGCGVPASARPRASARVFPSSRPCRATSQTPRPPTAAAASTREEAWKRDYARFVDVRDSVGCGGRRRGSLHLILQQRWREVLLQTCHKTRHAMGQGGDSKGGVTEMDDESGRLMRLCCACTMLDLFLSLQDEASTYGMMRQVRDILFDHIFLDFDASDQMRQGHCTRAGAEKSVMPSCATAHARLGERLVDFSGFKLWRSEFSSLNDDFKTVKFQVESARIAQRLGLQKRVPLIRKTWAFAVWWDKHAESWHRNRIVQHRYQARQAKTHLANFWALWREAAEGGLLLRQFTNTRQENQVNKDVLVHVNVGFASILREIMERYAAQNPILEQDQNQHLLSQVWAALDELGSSVVSDVTDKTLLAEQVDAIASSIHTLFECVERPHSSRS